MTYRAPTQDIRFVLKELADLDGVLALPGFEEVSQDLVDAVLEENARFVEQAIAPLNRDGDTSPAKWSDGRVTRSEEHTSELQSLMRISYAVFCLKKKKKIICGECINHLLA